MDNENGDGEDVASVIMGEKEGEWFAEVSWSE